MKKQEIQREFFHHLELERKILPTYIKMNSTLLTFIISRSLRKRRTEELLQNGDKNNVSKAVVDITNEMAKIGLATTTSENNNKKTPKRGTSTTTPKTPKTKNRPVGSAKKSVRIAAKPQSSGGGNTSGSGTGTENKSRPKSSKLRK